MLGQEHKVLLVGQVFHAELMHFLNQKFVFNEVLMLLFYRKSTFLLHPQSCAPLLPKRHLHDVVLLLVWQCLIDEGLQVLVVVHGGLDGNPLLLVSLRGHGCHGYDHWLGCRQG